MSEIRIDMYNELVEIVINVTLYKIELMLSISIMRMLIIDIF